MAEFDPLAGAQPPAELVARMGAIEARDVERLLRVDRLGPHHAPVVFSPAALTVLEPLAQRARAITRARFGPTINLYAPLYLSNHCVNGCTYCGFAVGRGVRRVRLDLDEAIAEAEHLLGQGVRHLLLVTGEDPSRYGLDELVEVAAALRPRVASLAVEIFPSDEDGYHRLVDAGVDGLVLYQETYDPERYAALHPTGPKRDFSARLAAMEAAGRAGLRSLGIGALLGLAPARLEACALARHAAWLSRQFPTARLAVSFPRLRPVVGGVQPAHPVDDASLAQFIVGMRLMFPDAELVVSTRESAWLRDRLLPLGVTRMSAGSRTAPGAYSCPEGDDRIGQFPTDDRRSVAEVVAAVRVAGFDPVMKDFDPAFVTGREWV